MDELESKAVQDLLKLAKFAIIAMLIIGGYLGQSTLLGLI